MIKTVSTLILVVLISSISFAQSQEGISIRYIRQKVDNLGEELKADSQVDNMYLSIHDDGKRWIYIEMQKINGLKSDEYALSKEITELIIKMLFKSVNYDLEQPIDLKTFANTFYSKGIQGVDFKAKNNLFYLTWSEILNIRLSDNNSIKNNECQNVDIPPAPDFTEAQITFPMEHLKDDFTCNYDIHYIGYILNVTDKFICLKDLQGVVHRIYYNKTDLDNANASWLPYIMIPGNKVDIDAVTCGNGGVPDIVKIKNLRR